MDESCPDCGASTQEGDVMGLLTFTQDLREERPVFGPSTLLQARARHCYTCRWMDLTGSTITTTRTVGAERLSDPLPITKRGDTKTICPACGTVAVAGQVGGFLSFCADAERGRSCWRTLFAPIRGVYCRTEAHRCAACGWIGVVVAALRQPAFSVIDGEKFPI